MRRRQISKPTLGTLYQELFAGNKAMSLHMPTVQVFASQCDTAVEFGVNAGCSTVALLVAGCKVTSYDIREHKWHRKIKQAAGAQWDFRLQSSLEAEPQHTDLLFVDSLHNYDQVKGELERHDSYVRRYIMFHDTVTFGTIGADGETGKRKRGTRGILPAITEFKAANPVWTPVYSTHKSHGLLILGKS